MAQSSAEADVIVANGAKPLLAKGTAVFINGQASLSKIAPIYLPGWMISRQRTSNFWGSSSTINEFLHNL